MYCVFKKRNIIFVVIAIIITISASLGGYFISSSSKPIYDFTIVIDAGHGGIDGGVVGVSGNTKESDINLEYAMCLESYFKSLNINVVQTRKTNDGLYGAFSENKKLDDMKKREEIITSANADIVISIHQNGYILPNQRGICAFFNPKVETSKNLAVFMQDVFKERLDNARKEALSGDYFILNCTDRTSVLVECGFLTNPEDEKLLVTTAYKEKVCYSIFTAVVGFLVENAHLQVFNNVNMTDQSKGD